MADGEPDKTVPSKSGLKGWLLLGMVALVAAGSGSVLPWLLFPEHSAKAAPETAARRAAVLPFGEVVVNLGEERLSRYLRVKILLVVDSANEKTVEGVLQEQKAFLKNWLISYLSDQTIQEVSRAVGVNRIRREVRDQFNAMLFSDGSEKINDVLFDEFVVQ